MDSAWSELYFQLESPELKSTLFLCGLNHWSPFPNLFPFLLENGPLKGPCSPWILAWVGVCAVLSLTFGVIRIYYQQNWVGICMGSMQLCCVFNWVGAYDSQRQNVEG